MTSAQPSANVDALWKTLITNHNRELTSNYMIVVSSVKNINHNTRYHLRAAGNLNVTRNGPTSEIITGQAHFKARKTSETMNSTYNVTKKGAENYKATGLALAIYMGIYSSDKRGMTTTLTASKSSIFIGGTILTHIGVMLILTAAHVKCCFGITNETLGARIRVAKKLKNAINKNTKQSTCDKKQHSKKMNTGRTKRLTKTVFHNALYGLTLSWR